MTSEDRRKQILVAALELAERQGYTNVTSAAVAERVGCSKALVHSYYNTMPQLKRAVMRHAIKSCNLRVIAQGLAHMDVHALKAPDELKERARAALA